MIRIGNMTINSAIGAEEDYSHPAVVATVNTVPSEASEITPLVEKGTGTDPLEGRETHCELTTTIDSCRRNESFYNVFFLATCTIALSVVVVVALATHILSGTAGTKYRAGAVLGMDLKDDTALANGNHAVVVRLETIASRMDDLDRRFQKMDESLQILLIRVTGHGDELRVLEHDLLDQGDDSVFSHLQKSIEYLARDSLASQTKLRNLTGQVQAVEVRVQEEMANYSDAMERLLNQQNERQDKRLQLLSQKVEQANELGVRFRNGTALDNGDRNVSTRLEAVASRMDDLDQRFQKMDGSLEILLKRVSGDGDDLHELEHDILWQVKDSAFGLMQESIQRLERDSLLTQTRLRNLTDRMQAVEVRVWREMDNFTAAMEHFLEQKEEIRGEQDKENVAATMDRVLEQLQLLSLQLQQINGTHPSIPSGPSSRAKEAPQQEVGMDERVTENLTAAMEHFLGPQIESQAKQLEFLREQLEQTKESSFRLWQDLNASVVRLQQQAQDTQPIIGALQSFVEDHPDKVTVTFDDLPYDCGGRVDMGYEGIAWKNVYYADPVGCDWDCCRPAVVSSPNVAYNGGADLATIAPKDSRDRISLFGFYASADSSDGMSLVVEGYKNGEVVATRTGILFTTSPTRVDFDSSFEDLDNFTFVGHGGSVPYHTHVVLDDIYLAITKNFGGKLET